MLDRIITSQSHLDDEIVAQKLAARDFTIYVSPEFEVEGETYRVLMDGHHSLAAAIAAGVDPEIIKQDATDSDRVALIDAGDIEGFLAACWMDGDYHFAVSRKSVW